MLSELPQPAIDLKPAVRFNGIWAVHAALPPQRGKHRPFSGRREPALRAIAARFGGKPALICGANRSTLPRDVMADIAATGLALVGYPHAKESLIAQGMDRERVEKMSVGQVIAIYTDRNYRRCSDDWEKLWYIPYSEVVRQEVEEKRIEAINPLGGGPDREVIPLASLLLPAVQSCRTAQLKLEREMASLRVIEALRMYVADHEGKAAGLARRNHGRAGAREPVDDEALRLPVERRHRRALSRQRSTASTAAGGTRFRSQTTRSK